MTGLARSLPRRAGGIAVGVTSALLLVACGGGDRELAGFRRDPVPVVAAVTLPDLTHDGADFTMRAEPGHLLLVYFGYANCPDYCPTTLSNVKLAREQLDDPELIDVAMVTVDPDRDLPILVDFVTGLVDDPDAHALGTDDQDRLQAAATPFGVSYEVSQADDGEIQVAHTTGLYAVDDAGDLVLTWQFDVSIDDLAADMQELLDDSST